VSLIRALIMLMVRRCPEWRRQPLTAWAPAKKVATRYMPLFRDEIQCGNNTIYKPLPRWAPFNILLHHWVSYDDGSQMHDHPRWSITICLKGELVEKTPWGEKRLKPGAVVFRSPRYIHGFRIEPRHSCRTWTLFIVGRRRHCQNSYAVTRKIEPAVRAA
jgi:hypothetical protein